MRTLGQKRSEYALNRVLEIDAPTKERFRPFSAGAPSMILQNGFGQSLAFWLAKGKGEYLAMFAIVKEWLCENGFAEGSDTKHFILNISEMDQTKYLAAQKETLALLEWVKRFANADL